MSTLAAQNILTDPLVERLSAKDFNAEEYVRELSSNCVGDLELQAQRKRISAINDETSVALKRNVFKNYAQFIETSKEISYLEAEMYQLSHQLTEERLLLQSFHDLSLRDDDAGFPKKIEKKEEKNNLASLLEMVEGCSHLTEVPGRYVVHQGSLMHLNAETMVPHQLVRAYLLNDSFLICSVMRRRQHQAVRQRGRNKVASRPSIPGGRSKQRSLLDSGDNQEDASQMRGPNRYRFMALFELDNLATVNLKDTDDGKNTFKVLLFPDNYIFQTETPEEKTEWLQVIDTTKQMHKYLEDTQKRAASQDKLNKKNKDYLSVMWLKEVPEDLDVFLAQRDFEAAVQLVQKTRDYLASLEHSQAVRDIKNRVESRVKNICQQLVVELESVTGSAGKGNKSSVRRLVMMLVQLGRSAKACELFLKTRSRVIDQHIRSLKIEGKAVLYVSRLSSAFFFGLMESAEEFQKTFSGNNDSSSAFVMWCIEELRNFAHRFTQQVFGGGNSLSVVAECVNTTAQLCDRMNEAGLELTFQLRLLMRDDIIQCLKENAEQLADTLRLQAKNEEWVPFDLSEDQSAIIQLAEDMREFGYEEFPSLLPERGVVYLARATVHFCKLLVAFYNDCLKVYLPEVREVFMKGITAVFKSEVTIIKKAQAKSQTTKQKEFINQNVSVLTRLLAVTLTNLEAKFGLVPENLIQLHKELQS